MDKSSKQEADEILADVGWDDVPRLIVRDWEVDQIVMTIGGCGRLGKIMDVQKDQCLVKFLGHKARWIDCRILLHYTTGE